VTTRVCHPLFLRAVEMQHVIDTKTWKHSTIINIHDNQNMAGASGQAAKHDWLASLQDRS